MWGQGLSHVSAEQLKFALDKTIDEHKWPPTLSEFKELCGAMPRMMAKAIETPIKLDYESVKDRMEDMNTLLSSVKPWTRKRVVEHWNDLKERGTFLQRRCAEEALNEIYRV